MEDLRAFEHSSKLDKHQQHILRRIKRDAWRLTKEKVLGPRFDPSNNGYREQYKKEELPFGPFIFHPESGILKMDEKEIHFTPVERKLVGAFARDPEDVHSLEELAITTWGTAMGVDTHAIEVNLYRIRKKMRDNFPSMENYPIFEVIKAYGWRLNFTDALPPQQRRGRPRIIKEQTGK